MKYATCLLKRYGKGLVVCVAAAVGAAVMLGSTCAVFNKPPTVPVISGPSAGVAGVPVTFKATATDPEGDSIAFQFDWGDTTTAVWSSFIASGETLSQPHTYADSGAYLVKAEAKDRKGTTSSPSSGQALSILTTTGGACPDSVYGVVHVPNGGQACCISPDGTQLCLGPGLSSDSVTFMRLADRTLLPCVRVDTMIGAVVFSTDNQSIYASSWWHSRALHRVDVASGRVVATSPDIGPASDVLPTPDGSRLLVGASQNLFVMRADSLAILDTVLLPYNSECMALNQAGTTLYVGVLHGLCAVDVQGCSIRMSTSAIERPKYAVLSPDEESLYVFCSGDTGVVVLRASDLAVARRVSMGSIACTHMKTTPDGLRLYVGIRGTRVYDTRTLAPVDSVVLSAGGGLAMHPNGDTAGIPGTL